MARATCRSPRSRGKSRQRAPTAGSTLASRSPTGSRWPLILSDSLNWIGPDLQALVDAPGRAVHDAIAHDLLVPGTNGRSSIDDSKRPVVAAQTAVLAGLFDRDDVLVAAWRDLVTACHDIDHNRYPSERIAFLHDILMGLSEHRRQDRGYFSPVSTAVQVLFGNPSSVRQAQFMVGDPVDSAYDPDAAVDLTEDQLADLAEPVSRPPRAPSPGSVTARSSSKSGRPSRRSIHRSHFRVPHYL